MFCRRRGDLLDADYTRTNAAFFTHAWKYFGMYNFYEKKLLLNVGPAVENWRCFPWGYDLTFKWRESSSLALHRSTLSDELKATNRWEPSGPYWERHTTVDGREHWLSIDSGAERSDVICVQIILFGWCFMYCKKRIKYGRNEFFHCWCAWWNISNHRYAMRYAPVDHKERRDKFVRWSSDTWR